MNEKSFYRVLDADAKLVAETDDRDFAFQLLPYGGVVCKVTKAVFWNETVKVTIDVESKLM